MFNKITILVLTLIGTTFIIAILFLSFIVLGLYDLHYISDEELEIRMTDIHKYLDNKYSEDMIIYDYSPYDSYYESFAAYVYPKNNKEMKFDISEVNNTGTYKDNYVENCFIIEAKNKIQTVLDQYFNYSEIDVGLFNTQGGTINEYLYDKYKNIQIPISWDNEKCSETLYFIRIKVYNKSNISQELKEEIENKIEAANVRFNEIEWSFEEE